MPDIMLQFRVFFWLPVTLTFDILNWTFMPIFVSLCFFSYGRDRPTDVRARRVMRLPHDKLLGFQTSPEVTSYKNRAWVMPCYKAVVALIVRQLCMRSLQTGCNVAAVKNRARASIGFSWTGFVVASHLSRPAASWGGRGSQRGG